MRTIWGLMFGVILFCIFAGCAAKRLSPADLESALVRRWKVQKGFPIEFRADKTLTTPIDRQDWDGTWSLNAGSGEVAIEISEGQPRDGRTYPATTGLPTSTRMVGLCAYTTLLRARSNSRKSIWERTLPTSSAKSDEARIRESAVSMDRQARQLAGWPPFLLRRTNPFRSDRVKLRTICLRAWQSPAGDSAAASSPRGGGSSKLFVQQFWGRARIRVDRLTGDAAQCPTPVSCGQPSAEIFSEFPAPRHEEPRQDSTQVGDVRQRQCPEPVRPEEIRERRKR